MNISSVTSSHSASDKLASLRAGGSTATASTGAVPDAPEQAIAAAELGKTVDRVNDALRSADEHLQFEVHEDTQAVVVRLMDVSTNKVLREFPSKKFLDMVAKLQELAGLQVDVTL